MIAMKVTILLYLFLTLIEFQSSTSGKQRTYHSTNFCVDCCPIIGAVTISPSPRATVCYVGDRLESTCNSTDSILKWQLTFFIEDGSTTQLLPVPLISSTALNEIIRVVNTSTLTFSRISERGLDIPLVSRLVIDSVSKSLNGTNITCMEVNTAAMATTTLYIVGDINGEIFFCQISYWCILSSCK